MSRASLFKTFVGVSVGCCTVQHKHTYRKVHGKLLRQESVGLNFTYIKVLE